MKKILLAALLMGSLYTQAAPMLTVVATSATGPYNNPLAWLTDGFFPSEGGQWQTDTVWWRGTGTRFEFDLGSVFLVRDVLLSVDNNDSYAVETSEDGSAWGPLFNIGADFGEIGWGMDTMSSDAASFEYVPGTEFAATSARYLRIQAIGGDGLYSVGEFQIFGDPIGVGSPLPAPGTLFLLGAGLSALGFSRKKR